MIQVKNLSVFYSCKKQKTKALGPINFAADSNDIYAIIGPSGCGKSTLLNVLSGIIKNYEGEVLLNEKSLNPHIHKIGFIPQNFGLLPWKTVEENCLLPFKIRKEKINENTINKMNSIMKSLSIVFAHFFFRRCQNLCKILLIVSIFAYAFFQRLVNSHFVVIFNQD